MHFQRPPTIGLAATTVLTFGYKHVHALVVPTNRRRGHGLRSCCRSLALCLCQRRCDMVEVRDRPCPRRRSGVRGPGAGDRSTGGQHTRPLSSALLHAHRKILWFCGCAVVKRRNTRIPTLIRRNLSLRSWAGPACLIRAWTRCRVESDCERHECLLLAQYLAGKPKLCF